MVRPAETSVDCTLPFSSDGDLRRRFMVVDEPLQGNLRFGNVDRDLSPLPVPPVYPTTYAEDARYLEAHRRHQKQQFRTAVAAGAAAGEGEDIE